MTISQRAIARIDLKKYDAAFSKVQQLIGPDIAIMSVVKANAYGLGVDVIAKRALQNGARFLAVAYLSEAIALRELGITADILVFTEPAPDECDDFVANRLSATIYTIDAALALIAACARAKASINVHINVDTGMSRLGCPIELAPNLVKTLASSADIHLNGLYSHFACSDNIASPKNDEQFHRYNTVLSEVQKSHHFEWIHMSNSAGIINFPQARFNMVRMGILSYENIVQLECHISTIRQLRAGDSISYNASHVCATDTRIATIPIGYADGIPISASNKIDVEINGKRYRQVGRVTMDSLMVDIGTEDTISIGDGVIFFGPQSAISLGEFAEKCGTISYEILCRIGQRVTRIYE